MAAGISKALFPRHLSVAQLLSVISKARPDSEESVEGFAYAIEDLWRECPKPQHTTLADRLAKLCLKPPHEQDYRRISAKHRELVRKLAPIALDAVQTLYSKCYHVSGLAIADQRVVFDSRWHQGSMKSMMVFTSSATRAKASAHERSGPRRVMSISSPSRSAAARASAGTDWFLQA